MPEFLKILNHFKRFRKNPKTFEIFRCCLNHFGFVWTFQTFQKKTTFKKKQSIQKVQKIQKTPTQQIPENSKNKQNRHKKKRNGMVWNVLEFYLMMGYNPITPLWVSLCMRAPILREENSYERSSTNGLIGTALQLEE